jgi:hypothetical protein
MRTSTWINGFLCIVLLATATSHAAGRPQQTNHFDAPPNIFKSRVDNETILADAVEQAKKEQKRVLITWGTNANCQVQEFLERVRTDEKIGSFLDDHFIQVPVNARKNRKLRMAMGSEMTGEPYLTVLNADGVRVRDHEVRSYVSGKAFEQEKLLSVLNMLAKAELRESLYNTKADARAIMDLAIQTAKTENKQVLITWGSDGIGACYELQDHLYGSQDSKSFMNANYVHVNLSFWAKDLREELLGGPCSGITGLTILGADGKLVADSTKITMEKDGVFVPAVAYEFLKVHAN